MLVVADDGKVDGVAVRLGEGLRAARAIAGINQRELARLLAVPANYVSRWETGTRRLEIDTIEQIERAMGLQSGTVFRLAGYVSDGSLLDLGSLTSESQRAIRSILREFEKDNPASDGVGTTKFVGNERSDGP